jgi:hypothetical protein
VIVAWFDSIWVRGGESELYDDEFVKCVFLVPNFSSSSIRWGMRDGGWDGDGGTGRRDLFF